MSAGRTALSGHSSHSSNSEHAYGEIADLIPALTLLINVTIMSLFSLVYVSISF